MNEHTYTQPQNIQSTETVGETIKADELKRLM